MKQICTVGYIIDLARAKSETPVYDYGFKFTSLINKTFQRSPQMHTQL